MNRKNYVKLCQTAFIITITLLASTAQANLLDNSSGGFEDPWPSTPPWQGSIDRNAIAYSGSFSGDVTLASSTTDEADAWLDTGISVPQDTIVTLQGQAATSNTTSVEYEVFIQVINASTGVVCAEERIVVPAGVTSYPWQSFTLNADFYNDGEIRIRFGVTRLSGYLNATVLLDCLDLTILTDCNGNGIDDGDDITAGTSKDCNANGIPDECEIAAGVASDCDGDGDLDECEIAAGALDNNGNGIPDDCELYTSPYSLCQAEKLLAPDGDEQDWLGYEDCIAFDANFIILGAPHNLDSGSAYVYRFVYPTGWQYDTKFHPASITTNESFGCSVDISGATAIIGAKQDDLNGSAYIYDWDLVNWAETTTLLASDGGSGDRFGTAVSIDDNVAVVGADVHPSNTNTGAAYVFRRSGTWTQEQKLTASDSVAGDHFGQAVAVSDDTIAVAAPGDDDRGSNSGSVYIFQYSGGTWTQTAKLTAPHGTPDDAFGSSLDMYGYTRLIVGAPGQNDDSGAAYIYRYVSDWTLEKKISFYNPASPLSTRNDYLGCSVAITANRAIIGAEGDNAPAHDSGNAHIYRYNGSTWGYEGALWPADSTSYHYFGSSVAIWYDTAVVAAWGDSENGSYAGAAYRFEKLRSDCAKDCIVNHIDLAKLAAWWLQTGCGVCNGADITDDGDLDGHDLQLMASQWLFTEGISPF